MYNAFESLGIKETAYNSSNVELKNVKDRSNVVLETPPFIPPVEVKHIDNATKELDKSLITLESLSNIRPIISNIIKNGGLDSDNTRVIDTCLNALAKTTNTQYNSVFESISYEDFDNFSTRVRSTNLVMEGIGDFFKAIWEGIKNIFKKIWGWMKSFWNWLFGNDKESDSSTEEIEKDIKELPDEKISADDLKLDEKTKAELANPNLPLAAERVDKVNELAAKLANGETVNETTTMPNGDILKINLNDNGTGHTVEITPSDDTNKDINKKELDDLVKKAKKNLDYINSLRAKTDKATKETQIRTEKFHKLLNANTDKLAEDSAKEAEETGDKNEVAAKLKREADDASKAAKLGVENIKSAAEVRSDALESIKALLPFFEEFEEKHKGDLGIEKLAARGKVEAERLANKTGIPKEEIAVLAMAHVKSKSTKSLIHEGTNMDKLVSIYRKIYKDSLPD